MHALKDFLSTDYGLMSAVVIAITLGMGVFYARYIMKHIREDAEAAARAGKETVSMADFEAAKDKVYMGPERRSRSMTEADKKIIAYHEAGHAVVGLFTEGSDPLHKITIVPRGRALGLTWQLPESDRYLSD